MTDTARDAAIERVRALAEGAMHPHEWGYRDPVEGGFVEDRAPFDLADHVLRLLLTDPRQPSEGWRPIESAPRDGTEFIATVRVFSNSAFSHHDMHIVAVDDETGELANHYEQGWRLEDYEFWRPLPAPPTGEGGGL